MTPNQRLTQYAMGDYHYPAYRGRPPAGTPTLKDDIMSVTAALIITDEAAKLVAGGIAEPSKVAQTALDLIEGVV